MVELNAFCPLVFFITGISNVLLIKWMSTLESEGSDGVTRTFQHPFVQTGVMFLGQILGYLLFKILFSVINRRREGSEILQPHSEGGSEFPIRIFLVPAVCDLLSTVMLLYGFYFTYASSAQIMRSTAIIFAGVFSVSYLDETIGSEQRYGMLTLLLGTILVCVADCNNANSGTDNWKTVLTGDLLVVCSQVLHSFQLVYEEKHLRIYNVRALQAAGWEGLLGFCILLTLLVPLNFINICAPFGLNAHKVIEDIPDAFYQLYNNYWLVLGHVLFMFSVLIYNYCGINITNAHSCYMNRIVFNSLGIFFIWTIALSSSWERFNSLQLFGCIVFVSGVFIYRELVFKQCYRWILRRLTGRRYDASDSDAAEQVTNEPADAI